MLTNLLRDRITVVWFFLVAATVASWILGVGHELGDRSAAISIIVIAFAKGDRKTLRGLLSKEVGEAFERAIAERERNRQTLETTFVSIDKAEIMAVEVRNRVAQVTVRFISNLITATRDAGGAVIDGSAETVVEVPDIWTFARNLGSRDPNWQLVATEAGA